ncbi:sulfatase-like hydrolase/transferase, partial [bacterium]|nr:sulfatase-like hydrolase/transferase [bacterium]
MAIKIIKGLVVEKTVLCALCLLIYAGVIPTVVSAQPEKKSQPDVVFIIVDDLNDWLGCLSGHPDAKSPNIDALASSGMLFSQAYCNSPQCRPSRTSLNYGVYPFKTGTYFNA